MLGIHLFEWRNVLNSMTQKKKICGCWQSKITENTKYPVGQVTSAEAEIQTPPFQNKNSNTTKQICNNNQISVTNLFQEHLVASYNEETGHSAQLANTDQHVPKRRQIGLV